MLCLNKNFKALKTVNVISRRTNFVIITAGLQLSMSVDLSFVCKDVRNVLKGRCACMNNNF